MCPSPPLHRIRRREEAGNDSAAREPRFDEQFLDLTDLMRMVRHHGRSIVGLGLAAALATAATVAFVLPPRYEASATLVVVPPQFSSQLKPQALSVQGYQRLLESDAVIGEAHRELVENGLLDPEDGLEVGNQLETRIFVSKRAEETALAPIIEAVAYGETPERAADIANTWVQTFLSHSRQLMVGATLPTVEFIESQYGDQQTKLEDLDTTRVETADDFQRHQDRLALSWDRRLDEAALVWDRRLVGFQKATEDRIAAYQSASRERLEALASESIPGLEGSTADVREEAGAALPDDAQPEGEAAASASPAVRGDGQVQPLLRRLVSLRVQVAQTSPVLLLEKAMTDDSLWQALSLSQTQHFEIQPLLDRNLLTQEVNPVYTALALRIAEVESELEAILESTTGAAGMRAVVSSLERLQRDRSAGLAKLAADRALQLDALQRKKLLVMNELRRRKQFELDALERQRTLKITQIERGISHQQALYNELASNYSQAALARRGESLVDVRLGSGALPPLQEESRGLLLLTALAGLLGGLAGFFVGVARESKSTERVHPSTTGGSGLVAQTSDDRSTIEGGMGE